MKLIDSHCHLDFEPLAEDVGVVIERAGKAGVVKIINIGTSLLRSQKSVDLASYYPNVWASVGLHPQDAGEILDLDDAILKIKEMAKKNKVVAIGEIGLDYSQIQNEKEKIKNQKELFIAQVELAQALNLPIIIHIRDAWDDFFKIIQNTKYEGQKGVVHCFTGDATIAKKIVDLGFLVGFTGLVTFKNKSLDSLREAASWVPIGKILIETDAPLLAPEPYRGKANEPAFVLEVAKKVAELKGLTLEDVAENTTKNAEKLFNI